MQVAASVTPRRHDADPTVLDERREPNARRSAAGLGGDVGGTDQIPMPLQCTMRTVELAALRLGDPMAAGRASGGRATLIHQPHGDACPLGFVLEGLEQVGAAPL